MSMHIGAKKWNIFSADEEKTKLIQSKTGLSKIAASLLCVRGITDENAESFINPSALSPLDPFLFEEMKEAVSRLDSAVESGEKICVYGDYDVDGITSVALLCRYLSYRGANFIYYIPERLAEGYGMNITAVKKLADSEVKLIVTVDNGVSAAEEVRYAYELGMEVIITDHHECRSELPECAAVINPKMENCGYPFMYLAGVGVAYKLICALEANRGNGELPDGTYLELVALGTIADMMPLCGENRALVSMGLSSMNISPCVGIDALAAASGAEKGRLERRKIDSGFVSFTIAPRINAAGRIGDTNDAVKLLITDDVGEAEHLAERLCGLNGKRQTIENRIFSEACEIIESEHDFLRDKVIVAGSSEWSHGVVGIVSSRITEKYRLPSILISLEDGIGKGSARSVKGFNINEAIADSRGILIRFGGHELAAGLTIYEEKIAEFKKRINDFARARITDEMLMGSLNIDAELSPGDINEKSVSQIALLEPFGCENPQPLFCMTDVTVNGITPIGGNKHLRLAVSKDGFMFTALMFGTCPDEFGFRVGEQADFAFNLDINEFGGRKSVQLVVRDVQLCKGHREIIARAEKAYSDGINGEVCRAESLPDVPSMRRFFVWLRKNEQYYSAGADLFFASRKYYEETGIAYPPERFLFMLSIFDEMGLVAFKRISPEFFTYTLVKSAPRVDMETSPLLNRLRGCTH